MSVNALACVRGPVRGPSTEPHPWADYLGAPSRAPFADQTLPVRDTLAWRTGVGRLAAGPIALGSSVLAVQTVNKDIALLSRETGAILWKRRLNNASTTGPLITTDRVYTATSDKDGKVYALRLATGGSAWERGLGSVTGAIALTHDVVVAATLEGGVAALDASTGHVRWRRRLHGPVRGGVTSLGDRVLVATDDSLYLLSTSDGTPVATVRTPGALLQPPAVVGDTIILGSPDGVLAALTRDSLRTLWSVKTGTGVVGSPAVARDTAFAVTQTGTLWCVPLAWPEAPDTNATGLDALAGPSPVSDGVVMASVTGTVAYATCGGPVRTLLTVKGPVSYPPLIADGAIVVPDGDGNVSSWR